jgi:hypothetical protein
MIERSSLVSIAFSHPAQQVLVVNSAIRPFVGGYNDDPPDMADIIAERLPAGAPPGARMYWKDWVHHYDYLYMIWTSDEANPLPDHLVELYRDHTSHTDTLIGTTEPISVGTRQRAQRDRWISRSDQ